MQPILITGGTGTLGRLVVARLRGAGCMVRVLSRSSREASEGIEFVTGDLARKRPCLHVLLTIVESEGCESTVYCERRFLSSRHRYCRLCRL
jgi:nucleoside-diphosphate-sugar epimerase